MPINPKNLNQFITVDPYIDPQMKPTWVEDPVDKLRLASYSLYKMIYQNVQHTYGLMQRGTDEDPIYIPAARKCIEATNRYLGVDFQYRVDGGNQSDRQAIDNAMQSLFRREKFYAKYNSLKRWTLIRGSGIWHITADPDKPAGRRISLHELDPAKYHPIYDINDAEKLLGVHIVEPYTDPKNKSKALVRRQTYRKVPNVTGPDSITSEEGIFEADGWDDRQLLLNPNYKMKPYQSIQSEFVLPSTISSIPVYHLANQYQSGDPFGTSDLAGFERVIAAVNQSITDEELALAYGGLGVFFTTAARPSSGWVIPPGSVIDGAAGETFERVNGLSSVSPSLDHVNYLDGELKQAMGTPDIAIGKVDVQIAQSGIALAFQMGPILTRNKEKEAEILAVHDHMLFDLANGWFPAYESMSGQTVALIPSVGDPMPKDRAAIIKEVLDLMSTTPPLISAEYGRTILAERLGFDFPDAMADNIIGELKAASEAQWNEPIAERMSDEITQMLGEQGVMNGQAG
jgi:hypothetical protein